MSLVWQCDVICLVCADIFEQGETQHDVPDGMGKAALEMAAKRGWKRKRGSDGRMYDVCPKCLPGWPGNMPTWLTI